MSELLASIMWWTLCGVAVFSLIAAYLVPRGNAVIQRKRKR